MESLWKFLIYTELARSVASELDLKPVHYKRSEEENELGEWVERHAELITSDFTVRLEHAVRELCQIDTSGPRGEQRARVSEILHTSLLAELRTALGKVLERKQRVVILVDNLDKAWTRRDRLDHPCRFPIWSS